MAIGLGVSALIVGPFLRASGASALSDFLATRFPSAPLKASFIGLLLAVGILIAAAGYEAAIETLIALFAPSRGAAEAIVGAILIMMIVPGGLMGLLWGAAASAGVLIIILMLPIAVQLLVGDGAITAAIRNPTVWIDTLGRTWSVAGVGDPATRMLFVLASALAIGALPPFASPAIASLNEGQALRAGALGLIFTAFIAFAAFVDLVLWPLPAGPMSSGLKASALLLAALTLCSAGVHSASRARGTNAGGAYGRYMPLASQRLARSRALMLAVAVFCAIVTYRLAFDPKAGIVVAAALSLSLIAPLIALAFSSRATSAHAIACLVVSVATAVGLGALERQIPNAPRLLIGALCAGAAGFVAGWSTAIFVSNDPEEKPVRRDLFIDAPLDPSA